MAKLSSYTKDASITEKDKLAGSSYVGLVNGIPKYQTASYTIEDLAKYFSENIIIGGSEYDITTMYSDIQNNKTSIASINTSLTVLANEDLALAQSITNLDTQFTTDLSDAVSSINITLTSLSTADLALAESITTLETSFTTDLSDAVSTINTSLTSLSTADAALATSITELETSFTTDLSEAVATINTELTTLSTADAALATSITELETSFTTDLSEAVATINTELTTLSTADQALATSITELETSFATDLSDAVATINTELTTLSNADSALATSITELETSFSTDLSDAVSAINTELTTLSTADQALATSITELETTFTTDLSEAVATINTELTTLSTADYAQAEFVTNLASSLGTTDAQGNLTVSEAFANQVLQTETTTDYAQAEFVTNLASSLGTTDAFGNLTVSEAFANQVLQTETTTNYAQAQFVTNLASSIGTVDEEGNLTVSEAFANSVLTTETTTDYATAGSVNDLGVAIGNIPRIYRQDDPPSVTETIVGSLWFDTNLNNKAFILVAGTPNVWTTVEDTEFTQFKSDYEEIINTSADSAGASAEKIERLNSVLEILDENGNLIPLNQAEYFDTITTHVDAYSATADRVSNLGAVFGSFDGETFSISEAKITEELNTYTGLNFSESTYFQGIESNIAGKPSIYRQGEEPAVSAGPPQSPANGSIWYDTAHDNKVYILTSGVWTLTDDSRIGATASQLNTVTASFGSYDVNTGFTFDGNSYYAEQITSHVDDNSATSEKVTNINTVLEILNPDGTANTTASDYLDSITTHVEENSASAAIARALNTELGITDAEGNVIKTKAQFDEEITSYVDQYSATAGKTDELVTQFVFDGNGEITSTTGTLSQEISEAESNAISASANKVETLAANFFSGYTAEDGSFTTVALSDAVKTAISSVVSFDGYAAAQDLEDLTITVQGENGTGGIYGSVASLQQTVAAKPNIFRQDEQPSVTEPIGSIWYDTNENNQVYILVQGNPNTWEITRDEGLINEIGNKPFIFRQGTQPAATNPVGSVWYDTSDGNTLYVLASGTPNEWQVTVDSSIATAQQTADSRPKVFRQGSEPSTAEPQYSIWYDTSSNNKTYVLVSSAWTETLDGRVTDLLDFVESKYSLTADANGVVTGMELYSSSGPNTVRSEVRFTADKFIIQSSTYDATPFVLDNNELKLNVPLNGVSGTFSGNLFAALGENSVVNPDAYVAFGNIEVSNEAETLTKNFPVLELSNDFRAIQARRAIYINTVTDDEFSGIRFFGTQLDENGDEDLANKGMSINADELRLQFFNDPGGTYVPTKIKWRDAQKVFGGLTYKTEIYAEYNGSGKPYIVIDGDVRFQGNVNLGGGEIIGHPIIEAGTSTSNAAGTSRVIKNIDLDDYGHILDTESIDITLANVTAAGNTTSSDIYVNNVVGDAFIFDTANPEANLPVGGLTWNIDEGTLDLKLNESVTLQVGQEEVLKVVNKTGSTLNEADFRAVRIRSVAEGGAQGQRLAVLLAQADSDANSATTIGLVTETILNNQSGFITISGKVNGINTTGTTSYLGTETWADGDILYLSPTQPGYLTNVKPQAPQHTIIIGWVVYAHANQGKIFVKVDNGYEIDELHNVSVAMPSAGDLLVYNDVDLTWENKKSIASLTMTGDLRGPSTFVIDPAPIDLLSEGAQGTVQIKGSIDVNGDGNFDGDVAVNGNVVIDGDLTVSGSITTITATNLAVGDNMIYLNNGSSESNPDLGFAGNYNDGTYHHTGLFRDATDGIWKFFQNYLPEPDASVFIDTNDGTFQFAPLQVSRLYGDVEGNVEGNVEGDVVGDVQGNVTGDLFGNADTATNADKLDNKHASEFTLAYVTSNNNTTTNNINVGDITAGDISASGFINGKIILNKTYGTITGTGQAVVGLNAVTSEVDEHALLQFTAYGDGYYQRVVMTCHHDGTLGGDWNVYLSIDEGDGVFIISPLQTNGVVTISIKTQEPVTPPAYVHIEYLGELNNLIKNPV